MEGDADEGKIELDEGKKPFRKIKDLKSENRKKRKPPVRPWSKIDRAIIMLIILATTGASGYLALKSRDFKLPGVEKPDLENLNPFNNEVVIEADTDVQKKAETIVSEFKSNTLNLSGVYGLYIIDLKNDYSFGVHQDEEFEAASLIKLPVMVGMYLADENGELDLDQTYVLKSEDKIAGSGSLYAKPAGYETSYRNLIRLMGQQSDNTAFNICRKYLGDENINRIAGDLGMVSTDIKTNITTPRDIGFFFKNLYQGKALNKENSVELTAYLTDTVYENWLAAGIPDGVKISHKYGRELHVVNDAGIVYDDDSFGSDSSEDQNPYVVVILSEGVVEREADEIFPALSRNIFELFNDNK